jgi:hypothetical protein
MWTECGQMPKRNLLTKLFNDGIFTYMKKINYISLVLSILLLVACGASKSEINESQEAPKVVTEKEEVKPPAKIVNLDCEMIITSAPGAQSLTGSKTVYKIDIDLDKEEAKWNYTGKKFTTNSNNPANLLSITNQWVRLGNSAGEYSIRINRDNFSAYMSENYISSAGYGASSEGNCKIVAEREKPKGF